jgi:uncharacterized protein YkuJ
MSNVMKILSQREISGFMSKKHREEIFSSISRRELVNGCSIDKPYVQDGQVFTLKLENGLGWMTITKDLIITLHAIMGKKKMSFQWDDCSSSTTYFHSSTTYFHLTSGYYSSLGRKFEVNGERVIKGIRFESNNEHSITLELENSNEPVTVSTQLVKSLFDMIDPADIEI